MNILDFKNARYVTSDNSLVDLEIFTDKLGWIPTTVDITLENPGGDVATVRSWLSDNTTAIAAFVAPPQLPPVTKTHFSSKTFFERYTEAEQDAVITASMTSVPIKKAYDKMWGSDFVDVTSQETIDGVDALISVGLLDASRKSDILSTEII